MVVMALDHVRDFFSNIRFDPTDLTQTSFTLFFTRWITHFCAPVFVFLAGTGIFLSASRGKSKKDLAWFLVTRGLWLVFLELTIVRWGWQFDLNYGFSFGQVIWAIGWSMVALAGLIFLPTWVITTFGVLMIALHNLFDSIQPSQFGSLKWLWIILHKSDGLEPFPGIQFFVMYPLIPWIGVMAAGYGFGSFFLLPPETRRKSIFRLGLGLTLGFILLRATNLYGDPSPWTVQSHRFFTFLSFLNCQKYPPSLLFLLMTLGPAMLALAAFEGKEVPLSRPFVIFGRVPLFYYILHLPLIHALSGVFAFSRYGSKFFEFGPRNIPDDYGYGLLVVYLVWIGVVLTLFPACRWFAGIKERHKSVWLSYL